MTICEFPVKYIHKIDVNQFMLEVASGNTDPCWRWISQDKNGYARYGEKKLFVHRLIYETLVNTIPNRNKIHHICRTRNCVNPQHLECLSQKEHDSRHCDDMIVNATKMNNHPNTINIRPHNLSLCTRDIRITNANKMNNHPNTILNRQLNGRNIPREITSNNGKLTGGRNKKLTCKMVDAIRHEHEIYNHSYFELGHKYGVSKSTIGKIINNKRYVHANELN